MAKVGDRLVLTKGGQADFATIKYIGLVPPSPFTWYGVEYDDPARGKHNGADQKTGTQYFDVNVEGAGGFIRADHPGISLGRSFRKAVMKKYATVEHHSNHEYHQTLSNFEVEVVGLEQVAKRLRNVGTIKEMGLENENIAGMDDEEQVLDLDITTLNLSSNLIGSLESLDLVLIHLPKLKFLALNCNRFSPLTEPVSLPGYNGLRVLQLNCTRLPWDDIMRFSHSLLQIEELQLGSNNLKNPLPKESGSFPSLMTLNLSENLLDDWTDTIETLSLDAFPNLLKLVMHTNKFKRLYKTNRKIQELDVRHNLIAQADVLEGLRGLWMLGNPYYDRIEIISRNVDLEILEGSAITKNDRAQAEIEYNQRGQVKNDAIFTRLMKINIRVNGVTEDIFILRTSLIRDLLRVVKKKYGLGNPTIQVHYIHGSTMTITKKEYNLPLSSYSIEEKDVVCFES